MINITLTSLSMVTNEGLQRIKIDYETPRATHLYLTVFEGENAVVKDVEVALDGGKGFTFVLLPLQEKDLDARAVFYDRQGAISARADFIWKKPLERTFYIMVSSHTDIGLHNSQYIQRKNSCDFADKAMVLCDSTADRAENDRYRYTMEGTWFWNNYGADRGKEAAKKVVKEYIKQDKIGVCCGVAGNHTQAYGLEEVCRSAYEKKRLFENWGLTSKTMTMIDNNGLSPSIITPYCEAGYKNVIFSPNQWNPLPSTVWQTDYTKHGHIWNCDAGGGGARIDIRYSSELPMVFFWEDGNNNRLLVWGCAQYDHGSAAFGLYSNDAKPLAETENAFAEQLPQLDSKYPYSVWLLTCYSDDQTPNMTLTDVIANWNAKWRWPKLRTLGNPDVPFEILRSKHSDNIPVLKGDITGGWYQHPVSAAELLADKYNADRGLPTAEKWSAVAATLSGEYEYPAEDFRRAWDYLLFNDEHSYGTSGYQGRRVYETWMQHRDWIEKAAKTAHDETQKALGYISSQIESQEEKYIVFNPTLLERTELIEQKEGSAVVTVPPFGYRAVEKSALVPFQTKTSSPTEPPVIENGYYKICFAKNGSLKSVFDKESNRELLDGENEFCANELVYTNDNHKTFFTPKTATFKVEVQKENTTVTVETEEAHLGAKIIQKITLPNFVKRIDIDNRILSARDMINNNRYYRYLYYTFPFKVSNARRLCHLNGTVAEYGKDVTGHGTDVYMAANEWCCCENGDGGVALLMLDSSLVEFGEIHPDKTDYANLADGSQMFVYLANDWLQMHCAGGSHLDYRFRFSIISYSGDCKTAGIPQAAELKANPVSTVEIKPQSGTLKETAMSFLKTDTSLRLLTLKAADDREGIIARFYGEDTPVKRMSLLGKDLEIRRNTVDEKPYEGDKTNGFITYRLGESNIRLKTRKPEETVGENGRPAPIGSVYTGLITTPRAACGEDDGQLYLLWGQSTEPDLSHYKLYRSENPDFTADSTTFVADVLPEDFVVGRYVDTSLKNHTEYFYRVCAVNKAGICGPLSEVFSAYTKEDR